MKTVITLQQTRGGDYNSIPSIEELGYFIKLSETAKDAYLQDNYYVNGHGEGADNLVYLTHAIPLTTLLLSEHLPQNIEIEIEYV